MNDNHKHLANTLIEIPLDTIARWNKEAQDYSMERFNRVESAIVERDMKWRTEIFRLIERHKNTTNDIINQYSNIIDSQDKTIKMQEALIEKLKMQIK